MLDVPVTVSLRHLDPHTDVTIRASATDDGGVTWTSSARFRSSGSGTVSLGDRSTAGSYRGSYPMGLFTSMRPDGRAATSYFAAPRHGYQLHLRASVGSTTVARTSLRRVAASSRGVTSTILSKAHDGVVGRLYLPRGVRHRPALLMIGGSEGGESNDFNADLLAQHGFPALSIAYFKAPGLPQTLTRIPLEYFVRALRLLAARREVDRDHVLVFGASRGSEAALLLGAHFPNLVHGVVAASPSDHVSGNFPGDSLPAWTLRGRPVPTAPGADFSTPHPADAPRSIVAVASIAGPVMTVCGKEDLLWPSCRFAASIHAQRVAAGVSDRFPGHDQDLRFADAGHAVDLTAGYFGLTRPLVSPSGLALGGTKTASLAGAGMAHTAVLRLLAHQER